MDPTCNLREQNEIATCIQAGIDAECEPAPEDAARLTVLVLPPSEWLAQGGSLSQLHTLRRVIIPATALDFRHDVTRTCVTHTRRVGLRACDAQRSIPR